MFHLSIQNTESNPLMLNSAGQVFLANMLNNKGVGMCIHEVVYNQHGFAANYKVIKANECYIRTVNADPQFFNLGLVFNDKNELGYPWGELYRQILARQQVTDQYCQDELSFGQRIIEYYFDADHLIITLYEKQPETVAANEEPSPIQISARIFSHNHFFITFDSDLYIRYIAFDKQTEIEKSLAEVIGSPLSKLPGFNHPTVFELLKKALQGHRQKFIISHNDKTFDCLSFPLIDAFGKTELVAIEGKTISAEQENTNDLMVKDAIISHSLTGLLLTDHEGTITYANPAVIEMWYMKSGTDPLGKPLPWLWSDQDLIADLLKKIKQEGAGSEKLLAKRANGSEFWVKFSGKVITDGQGQMIGIVGSLMDISPEIEAKNQSEISRNNFKRFYNTIPDFLIVFDDDYRILEINNYVTAYLGYTKNELANVPVFSIYKNISEKRFQKNLDDLFNQKKDYCSCKMLSKDGQEIAVETNIFRGLWNNQPAFYCINKDVSELQQSEEKFTKAFHTSPAIVSLTELDTAKFIGINEIFSKKLGYSFEEVIGYSSIDMGIVRLEDREKVVQKLKLGEKISELNVTFTKKNGEPLFALVSSEILSFQGKKYLYMVAQDISRLHTLELMQNQVVELYHQMEKASEIQLIGYSIDACKSILNAQGGFVHFMITGDNGDTLLYYKTSEKEQTNCFAIHRNELPTDSAEWFELLEKHKPVILPHLTSYPLRNEHHKIFEADGMVCCPVVENGKVIFMAGTFGKKVGFSNDDLCVVETIAENLWNIIRMKRAELALMESEYKLKEAQQIAHLGLWEYDLKSGIIKFSDELEQIFGFRNHRNSIQYDQFMSIVFPDDRSVIERKIVESMNKTEPVEIEHRVVLSDGSIKFLNQKFSTRFDEKNRPERLIGTLLDITPQRMVQNELIKTNQKLLEITQELRENQLKLETRNNEYQAINKAMKRNLERISQINIELNAAKEKAEESNRLKTAFLQNLSHEVRTPMNGIVGFASMLNLPNLTDDKRKYFADIIVSSTDQLLNIINDILDFSRIEAGQVEIKKSWVNIHDQLVDLQSQFEFEIQNKGLQFKLFLPKDSASNNMVYSDPEKVKKIWVCLLKNALKFTQSGSIEIGYAVKPGLFEFFVKDSGIGIAPEFHQIIFERFRQVEEVFSRNYGGNGLGLSICKGYCQLLGGKIWVESQLGQGSVFRFTLPMGDETHTEQIAGRSEADLLTDKTILIVEDELLNFLYLDEVLTGINIRTLHAKNGVEAIEMFRQNPKIDMVLMDIKMPEMNGIEATRRLKEMKRDLPVIIQTAYAVDHEKQNAVDAGCDAFMSKPLRKNDLISCMNEIFQKRIQI